MGRILFVGLIMSLLVSHFAYANMSKAKDKTNLIQNKELDFFYENTQSMQADFLQTVSHTDGKVSEKTKGRFIFDRPNRFIFEYLEPSVQKYISNSETLWIYDVELEQVNIKDIKGSTNQTPIVLFGDNKKIYQDYIVKDMPLVLRDNGNGETDSWVELISREEEASFTRILIGFSHHKITKLKMYDDFGNITLIEFSNIKTNKSFSNNYFNFTPPQDIDIIDQRVK